MNWRGNWTGNCSDHGVWVNFNECFCPICKKGQTMNEKWVFKIDTPWGKKGENVAKAVTSATVSVWEMHLEKYPDLFEKVKSDVQVIGDYLSQCTYIEVAPKLLKLVPDLADRIRRQG